MKKAIVAVLLGLLALSPAVAIAGGGQSNTCDTRYPVVLAHGMAVTTQIMGIMDCWWGIEDPLREEGCDLYFTSVNCMDSTENKAGEFKRQLLDILAVSGASKANVIGHSHGTIYSRCAITNMGMASKVATYTSLAGPHKGSSAIDVLVYKLPEGLRDLTAEAMDLLYTWAGDTNPDTLQNCMDVCTDYMTNVFNPNTPNMPGIYYQSWAAKAKRRCPTAALNAPWLVMLAMEGANDGLVGVESAKWGAFRGVEDASWWSPGCDHFNMVGHMFGATPGFDAPDFFIDIVSDLKNKGY